MTTSQAQASGFLIANYRDDLEFFKEFQLCLNGSVLPKDYLAKSTSSFQGFLNGYRIARNVKKPKVPALLEQTIEWVSQHDKLDPDAFASHLKSKLITYGLATVAASKLLFLASPTIVLPMDNYSRTALSIKGKPYACFTEAIFELKKRKFGEIDYCVNVISEHLSKMESHFEFSELDFQAIRKNRFLDKWLWTLGRNSQTIESETNGV